MDFSPFARQLFVGSATLLAGMSVGGALVFPTVLLHQLKNDSSMELDFETASWIGAIHGVAGLPSILMPTIMQWRGRKFAFITTCLISIIGWVLTYTAKTTTAILISESFHGLGSSSIYTVICLSMTEMIAPKYRDAYIQMYYVAGNITMALTGLLIQYLHWKTISIVMCIPMVFALLISCMWPESPYWLAHRGELDKCIESFTWLRGTDESSKKELNELLNAKKESLLRVKTVKKSTVKHFWRQITSSDFYIPCFHIFVLQYLFEGIGCMIMMIYSVEIIQRATSNKSVIFLASFITNTTILLGVVSAVVIHKYFNKKTVLLSSITFASTSLVAASTVSYFQSIGLISLDSMACFGCIFLYLVSISSGIVPTAGPVASALMPVKYRGLGGVLFVTNSCILHTLALKFTPYLLVIINLWGTLLVFVVNGIFCGLVIWKFIPETNGRTLQEIENFYTYGKFVDGNRGDNGNLEPMISE